MKHKLAVLFGVVIVLADLYWGYIDYKYATSVALAVIIFIASAIWLYFDF